MAPPSKVPAVTQEESDRRWRLESKNREAAEKAAEAVKVMTNLICARISILSDNVRALVQAHIEAIDMIYALRHSEQLALQKGSDHVDRSYADLAAREMRLQHLTSLNALLEKIVPGDLPYVPDYTI